MILIPDNILTQYDAILLKRSVPATCHASYKKWLRYYLDFCGKYMVPDSKSDRVRLFIDKLWDKKQTPEQQKQAAHAVKVVKKGTQPIYIIKYGYIHVEIGKALRLRYCTISKMVNGNNLQSKS